MTPEFSARRSFLKKRNSPLTFGFTAIADFSSLIGQEYVAGIMKACENYGISFINMASSFRPSLFVNTGFLNQYLSKIQFMHAPLLDGLITWASSLTGYMKNEEIQNLFSSLSPLPMVDIGYLDIPGIPSIRIDNNYSIHLIVSHLVKDHGFKKIAFIGSKSSIPHQNRLSKFKKEMSDFGLSVSDDMIFLADSLDEQDITLKINELVTNHLKNGSLTIDAIVTASDIIAHQTIEELKNHSIFVPDDVAVTGFNNQFSSLTSSTPVTTIDLAYFQRGYEAVELLIDRIMLPKEQAASRTVKSSLIIRQSCGCFEESIIDSQNGEQIPCPALTLYSANELEIRGYLSSSLAKIFKITPEKRISELISAIISDLYDTNVPPPTNLQAILYWFRKELSIQLHEKFVSARLNAPPLSQEISSLRRILLSVAGDDITLTKRIENILHSVRSLVATHEFYETISRQGDSEKIYNLMNLALSFSKTASTKELVNTLGIKLNSLSIPGIILCLSPAISSDLNSVSIELAMPDTQNEVSRLIPLKVRSPALFPKRLFQKSKPFFMTLTILSYGENFLGYAYILMNTGNPSLYDDLQELLSQNLYRLYKKEGKTKHSQILVTERQHLTSQIEIEPEENPRTKNGKLTADKIIDYLLDHIGEMCDLEKMSVFFGMSKSYLTRRTKELTGHSTQVLHERLKIEQAKNLIKSGKMKMNDISAMLGFSNPNYFSNVFKKVTGIRPTEYAEQFEERRF